MIRSLIFKLILFPVVSYCFQYTQGMDSFKGFGTGLILISNFGFSERDSPEQITVTTSDMILTGKCMQNSCQNYSTKTSGQSFLSKSCSSLFACLGRSIFFFFSSSRDIQSLLDKILSSCCYCLFEMPLFLLSFTFLIFLGFLQPILQLE